MSKSATSALTDPVALSWEGLPGALRILRKRRGLSTYELAAEIDTHASSISRNESDPSNPTWATISRTCIALRADVDLFAKALRVSRGDIPDLDYRDDPDARQEAIISSLLRDVEFWRRKAEGLTT